MRTYKLILLCLACLVCLIGLASCGAGKADPSSAAVTALSAYLKAMVDKDEAKMTSLVCPDWKTDALMELDSFGAVETKLDGLACSQSGSENGAVLATCQGKIQARYQDQTQAFDLSEREYRMEKTDAGWQVCGYTLK